MTAGACITKFSFLRIERKRHLSAITESGVKKLIVPSPFRSPAFLPQFPIPRSIGARGRGNYLRPVAFSLCLSIGLALFEQQFWTPNRTEIVLPGVR
jgi:hypothetical protein